MNINKKPRILITGNEIGGQMQLLAQTFRKKGFEALAVAFDNKDFRKYQTDINLNSKGTRNKLSKSLFFIWSLSYFDVYHFIFGVSFLSFWRFHRIDLPILRFLHKKIVVHFRGSDVIDKYSYYEYLLKINSWNDIDLDKMSRPDQRAKIKNWSKYSDIILVSTPNLLDIIPEAIISPQVIDLDYWTTDKNPLSTTDGIIRIAHAPTTRKTKGTELIIESVNSLKKKGHKVELVLIENIPHTKVKEIYERCDIGVDQLLVGWHGKVAVEMMALNKPVICNINPKYLKVKPDLPLVQANKNNLSSVIESLIKDEEKRKEIGLLSRKYVEKYHDVNKEVDKLLQLYGFEKDMI